MDARDVAQELIDEVNPQKRIDLAFEFDSELPPSVPPGDYTVAFLSAERKQLWKRPKLFLHFVIIAPEKFAGLKLFMAASIPDAGEKFTLGMKFVRTWTLAAGSRPLRRDRLSVSVFRGKYFKGRVRTVTKTEKGTARSVAAQYSVLDELLEIVAGGGNR